MFKRAIVGNVYRIPTRSFSVFQNLKVMRSPKYCMVLPNKCMTLLAKWTSTRHLSPLLKTRSYHRGTKTSYLREQGCLWVGKTLLKNLSVI